MPDTPPNGWNEWGRFVLAALKEGKEERKHIVDTLLCLRVDFEAFRAQMLARAGVWGALAGLIPAVAVLLLIYLRG